MTKFPYVSPRQRFFVVDTPVSFICDTSINSITRYDNYLISPPGGGTPATQPTASSLPSGGNANLLINKVSACLMSFDPGSATRAALVTISITVTDDELNESVTLLQQAHVDNQP